MLVFGTRPEAIKMCPLVKEFQKYPDEFETIVCVTGQHREMLDQVLKIFEVTPNFDLNIMKFVMAFYCSFTGRGNKYLFFNKICRKMLMECSSCRVFNKHISKIFIL